MRFDVVLRTAVLALRRSFLRTCLAATMPCSRPIPTVQKRLLGITYLRTISVSAADRRDQPFC
ncbi:MAG: hypothetical protein M3541_15345 [Acidobacteriota bacterium]|nr:hypothetical protein [Acidobacteriota bacterium]MDQ3420125.1 hypothetical protein [Acidobacteriota bacterium]